MIANLTKLLGESVKNIRYSDQHIESPVRCSCGLQILPSSRSFEVVGDFRHSMTRCKKAV